MKRLAATTLALIFLVLSSLFGGLPASAQPIGDSPAKLRLDLAELTPRVVDPASGDLRVSATITNTGDRPISNVRAQVRLGSRQTTSKQLSESLADPPTTDGSASKFTVVAEELPPGKSVPLALAVPLQGEPPESLQIPRSGVYPLLVNINGKPDYGGDARLAALSTMLPVLGAPGQAPPERPETPTGVSMLWPIADSRPRVLDAPNGNGEPIVLGDDDLANQLAPGGRLDALVSAALGAQDDPQLAGSLCYAIDPDLLTTVNAMVAGYKVRDDSGATTQGKGAEAAARWLGALKELVAGQCVVQTPFADADLTTLSRIPSEPSRKALTQAAVDGGPTIKGLLGVEPVSGVLWPGGPLDGKTLEALPTAGISSIITDPDQLRSTESDAVTTGVGLEGSNLRAQPADSLLATALGGASGLPQTEAGTTTPADEPDIATQNGIAALAFRTSLSTTQPEDPMLVTPPRAWNASASELSTFLDTLRDFTGAGMVAPMNLQELLSTPPDGTATMAYDAPEKASEASDEVINRLSEVDRTIGDLRSAMTVDPTTRVEPDAVLAPLQRGILRASSTAWRDETAATTAAGVAEGQLASLRNKVRIIELDQVISPGSENASLPVFLRNDLPVNVRVRVDLSQATGIRPYDVGDYELPANAGRNTHLPVEAVRGGRFNINILLRTPSQATQLGPTARFELEYNEYGAITIVLTATAAGALLLLSGRRLYQRARARRRATEVGDYPGSTETVDARR